MKACADTASRIFVRERRKRLKELQARGRFMDVHVQYSIFSYQSVITCGMWAAREQASSTPPAIIRYCKRRAEETRPNLTSRILVNRIELG